MNIFTEIKLRLLTEEMGALNELEASPNGHAIKRQEDRVSGIANIELPEGILDSVPQEHRIHVRNNLVYEIRNNVRDRITKAMETPFIPEEDERWLIVLKIGTVVLDFRTKKYPVTIEAEYSDKKNKKEGIGDMYYMIVMNDYAYTLILRDSKTSDEELKKDAYEHYKRNRHKYPQFPLRGTKVMGAGRVDTNSPELEIVIDLDKVIDVSWKEDREDKGKLIIPPKTKLKKGVAMRFKHTKYGTGQLVDFKPLDASNKLFDIIMVFKGAGGKPEKRLFKNQKISLI
jgi:hypothetical protein